MSLKLFHIITLEEGSPVCANSTCSLVVCFFFFETLFYPVPGPAVPQWPLAMFSCWSCCSCLYSQPLCGCNIGNKLTNNFLSLLSHLLGPFLQCCCYRFLFFYFYYFFFCFVLKEQDFLVFFFLLQQQLKQQQTGFPLHSAWA